MKFHIVRNKETLEDILYIYNLNKDELIEQNKHIRVWDKLIPGTKLKIPAIPDSVEIEVSDIEPFVEDYYPTVNHDIVDVSGKISKEDGYKKIDDEVAEEEKEEVEQEDNPEGPQSSKIYQDYDNVKITAEKNEEVEAEEDVKEYKEEVFEPKQQYNNNEFINNLLLTQYSNMHMQTKPLVNNYYPYYLGVYNAPRYIPYPIIYYPVYYPKKPN